MKKAFLAILTAALLLSAVGAVFPLAASADHSEVYDVSGVDVTTTASGVFVYPNEGDTVRVIGASEYHFRYATLLIFDKDGWLIEAGANLLANENGVNGSPQLAVSVPAGGFLVAFGSSAPAGLKQCYQTAMEGAMLYNATMSVIYKVHGSYDKGNAKLTIAYDDPAPVSSSAKRYLFVGNSTTYFNGTPIKFKGLAQAAGAEVDVEYCTFGSAYLSEFADETHERGKALRNKLNGNSYDFVVLQDAGSADYHMTQPAVDTILPLIEANGATALLYMRYSSSSDPALRLAGSKEHYDNYSRLAEEYGLDYAPVAPAFLICAEKYPEINLYADDNSHHSAAGSYLIACVWLQSYLGIDPRGNAYTANLPEEVAAALQECAAIACEEGYAFPEEDTSYTVDGVKYEMISKDKPYTVSGEVYTGDWTDADESGNPLGKRTDGKFALTGEDTAIGCWSGDTNSTTVDLGVLSEIKVIRTDLWGGTWGIPDPNGATVTVEISADGKSFTSVGDAVRTEQTASGEWKKCDFTLILDEAAEARYVRVTYRLAGRFGWSSEVGIYGTAKAQEDGNTSENSSTEVSGESSAPAEASEQTSGEETMPGESKQTVFAVIAILLSLLVAIGIVINRVRA